MERDVEIYLEDQYLDTFFEDRIQKIVVHPLKPGKIFLNFYTQILDWSLTDVPSVCFGCKKLLLYCRLHIV